jgi:hypothetical protein
VKLNIEISNSALYTLRSYKQTWVLMLFGLLGSVFGVMGALSFIMKFMEMMYNMIYDYLEKRRDLHKISENTMHLASALPRDQQLTNLRPFDDYSTPRATQNTERDHKGIFYMFRIYSPVRVVPTDD